MNEQFGFAPDPENDGWHVRPASEIGTFVDVFGEMRVRADGPRLARIRLIPGPQHRNIIETVHGGFLLAFVDQSLFVGPAALGIAGAFRGMTIDTATQFLAPVLPGMPLDSVVEILRETGRMIFMRGIIEQEGVAAVAFSGTIRKASER